MRLAVLFLSSSVLLLLGCGVSSDGASSPVPNESFSGVLMGGQQPISGATVTVYEAGISGYGQGAVAKASTTTSATGGFSFASGAYTCSAANAPMYLTASSGNPGNATTGSAGNNPNIMQLAVLGPCAAARSSSFQVNEVTTAAAVIAMAPFMSTTMGAGQTVNIGATCTLGTTTTACPVGTYNKGLVAAMTQSVSAMINEQSGAPQVTRTAGTVTITTEASKLYSLGNILASCVNSTGETSTTETTTPCGRLFSATNATGATTRPYNTVQAMLMIALYPYYNVSTIYGLAATKAAFSGDLTTTPSDWTVAQSYTSTAFGLGVNTGTSSNISLDAAGDIWFPSTKTGATGVGFFNPSTGAFNGPYITGLTHPQYVAVDNNTTVKVWANDMSAGRLGSVSDLAPTAAGTLVNTTRDGTLLVSTGPMFADNAGNMAFSGVNATGATNYVVLSGATTMKSVGGNTKFQAAPTGLAGYTGSSYGDYGFAVAMGSGTSTECYGMYMIGNSPDSGTTVTTNYAANTSTTCTSGGVAFAYVNDSQWDYFGAATTANMICSKNTNCASFAIGMSAPEGLVMDGSNRLWIANSGNGSVSILDIDFTSTNAANYTTPSSIALQHGTSHGATAPKPYGIGVDASGNVWMSNAGCTTTGCTPTSFVLTEIFGAATPTITPLSQVSKSTLYNKRPTS